MESFPPELRQQMFEANGYRCGIDPTLPADDAHHIKRNCKVNRKKWPHFIQSPFNLFPVNHGKHLTAPLPEPPSDLVCDVFENYLRGLLNG